MATIIAKNNTKEDIIIDDLGITISTSKATNLTDIYNLIEIIISKDLEIEVSAGNIIINDGLQDLNIETSLDHISIHTKHEILNKMIND